MFQHPTGATVGAVGAASAIGLSEGGSVSSLYNNITGLGISAFKEAPYMTSMALATVVIYILHLLTSNIMRIRDDAHHVVVGILYERFVKGFLIASVWRNLLVKVFGQALAMWMLGIDTSEVIRQQNSNSNRADVRNNFQPQNTIIFDNNTTNRAVNVGRIQREPDVDLMGELNDSNLPTRSFLPAKNPGQKCPRKIGNKICGQKTKFRYTHRLANKDADVCGSCRNLLPDDVLG